MGAEKLIFPGVGAFEQAMGVLRSKEYTEPLREYIQASGLLSWHLTDQDAVVHGIAYSVCNIIVKIIMSSTLILECVSGSGHPRRCQLYMSTKLELMQIQTTLLHLRCLHMMQSDRQCLLQAGKPFLGICLGMQLLFEGSEENGGVEGLGVIPGRVTKFDTSLGLPVPHIGWNTLEQRYAYSDNRPLQGRRLDIQQLAYLGPSDRPPRRS